MSTTRRVRSPEDAAALRQVAEIQNMLLHAVLTGGKLTCEYAFHAEPTFADLAAIERAVNKWIVATMRHFKVKLPSKLLRFPVDKMRHKDDGENRVSLTLDFATIFPGERPPEYKALADRLFGRQGDAPATPPVAPREECE